MDRLAKQRDLGLKQGSPWIMVNILQAVRVIYSEEWIDNFPKLSFRLGDHLTNLEILGIEPQHPIIEHVAFLLIESDLSVLVEVLIIMRHLCEIDRSIVTSELVISASHSVKIR